MKRAAFFFRARVFFFFFFCFDPTFPTHHPFYSRNIYYNQRGEKTHNQKPSFTFKKTIKRERERKKKT